MWRRRSGLSSSSLAQEDTVCKEEWYGRNCVGSSFSSRINSSRLARHVTRTLSLSNVSLSAGSNSTICFDLLAKDPGGYTRSTYRGVFL